MKLLDPIYDASFKHLMEDKRIARFFLSVLLDKEIEIDSFKPQEISVRNEDRNTGFSTPRMDFIAIIKDGEKRKKVLIELQQCFYESDISRFRTYLGKNYTYQDSINNQTQDLEIISIYILGFSINVPVAVIKTSNELIDASTKERLNITTDDVEFIAKLNHQSIFVDITKLETKIQTRVEKLLAIFNPKYRNKGTSTINIPDDIAQEIKSLNTAQEQKNPILEKLEDALLDHEVLYAIDQQEKFSAHFKKEKEKSREEGIETGEKQKAIEMARKMKMKKFDVEEIAELTGLSIEEINNKLE
ncbi:MAG: hypothetical protein RLZZ210_649 [Pseudomonadota bacterium]|jgi:predicted transposase/invertase (TIGR01784 family)